MSTECAVLHAGHDAPADGVTLEMDEKRGNGYAGARIVWYNDVQEVKRMAEEKNAGKPSLWNQALRVVKGDSTAELVEQFTQEMTLVAEGLCEDQARLRRAVDGLIRQAEGDQSRAEQDMAELQRQIDDNAREAKQRLDALVRRVEALERPSRKTWRSLFCGDALGRVTLLASIICGTVLIVTVLKLFI